MAAKLPYSLDAEKSVLGAIFLNHNVAGSIIDELSEDDFFDSNHVLIYQAIKDLFHARRDIDYTTVAGVLERKSALEKVGGITTIIDLSNYTVALDHLESYVDIVRDFSLKRELIKLTQSLATKGLTTEIEIDQYMEQAEVQIYELARRRKVGSFKPIPEIVSDIREKLHFLQSKKGGITGLSTGFTKLDSFINGLQPEELIIIAARPSVGKSALALQLALNAAAENKNGRAHVAFFSLEMSNEQLVTRMIANMSNIENHKLRTGFLTPKEWQQFEVMTTRLENINIYFDDLTSSNIGDIRAKSRKLSQDKKLDLIVIDYLQLISTSERTNNRQEEVSKISRSLKQLARELKVPVIALSQLSRAVDRDPKPQLSHLRESGSIEQDADIVMFLHREDSDQGMSGIQTGDIKIMIAKNRQGRIGDIDFVFAPNHSRFAERAESEEETRRQ